MAALPAGVPPSRADVPAHLSLDHRPSAFARTATAFAATPGKALRSPHSFSRADEGRSLRELQRELESLKSSLSVYLGNGLA